MSHTRWEELLGPLMDGELPAEQAQRVREHAAGCAGCGARLAQLGQLAQSLRSLPQERMPQDLKTALLRQAAADAPDRRKSALLPPWAIASLASAALVMIVALIATRPEAPPVQVATPAAGLETAQAEPEVAAKPESPAHEEELIDRLRDLGYTATTDEQARKQSEQESAPKIARQKMAAAAAKDKETFSPEPDRAGAGGEVTTRYTTEVIRSEGDIATLGPIVAVSVSLHDAPANEVMSPQSKVEEPSRAAAVRAETGASRSAAAAPAPAAPPRLDGASDSRADATVLLGKRRGPPGHLTFLVSLAEDGRILSAQQIGARTESVEVVDAVRSLLEGATVTPRTGRGTMSAVVEVHLPALPVN